MVGKFYDSYIAKISKDQHNKDKSHHSCEVSNIDNEELRICGC